MRAVGRTADFLVGLWIRLRWVLEEILLLTATPSATVVVRDDATLVRSEIVASASAHRENRFPLLVPVLTTLRALLCLL